MTEPTTTPSDAAQPERLPLDELRGLFLFDSLTEEQLTWLRDNGRVTSYAAGTTVAVEADPATCFYVLLDGTLALTRKVRDSEVEVNRTSHRGVYAGAIRAWLPPDASEEAVKVYNGTVRAVTDCRFLELPAAEFGAKIREWFPMAVHMLEGLYQGMRNSNAVVGQRERLLSLGQLTAGLTHELNNPAAAAVRATATLRERVAGMRHKLSKLADGRVDPENLVKLTAMQEDAIERSAKAPKLTAMQASDREDEITDWLDDHGVYEGWQIAQVFVAAGLDTGWLDEFCDGAPEGLLDSGLRWIAYALETEQLMSEIEDSTERISGLVAAAKQYSQMDRAEYQLVDIHDGIDSTVVMLGRKFSDADAGGVTLVKEYDRSLPRVPVYAGELNQVWTNLIDNALGAMKGKGTLTIRTSQENDCVLVQVRDTGPGVPPELTERIFEPFFTTKPVGEGTGLGLDISWRIVVKRHGGDLRVVSVPGDTTFEVRLPLEERTEGAGPSPEQVALDAARAEAQVAEQA
jgi:signal transduction histidine kinase